MEEHIKHLPLEVQTIIRQETPCYCQLSKEYHVGEKYLEELYMKPITKEEYYDYFEKTLPDRTTIYVKNDKHFLVYEIVKMSKNYKISLHSLDLNQLIISHTDNMTSRKQFIDFIDTLGIFVETNNITFDLYTTQEIKTHKNCDLNKYLNNDWIKHTNINQGSLIEYIIKTYYIKSNILTDRQNLLVFTLTIKRLVEDIDNDDINFLINCCGKLYAEEEEMILKQQFNIEA